MVRKLLVVLVTLGAVLALSLQPAFADKGGIPNRDRVPACDNPHGKAPLKNPHCYPPRESGETDSESSVFTTTPDSASPGGPTVGMALGLGAVVFAGGLMLLHRRRVNSLRA